MFLKLGSKGLESAGEHQTCLETAVSMVSTMGEVNKMMGEVSMTGEVNKMMAEWSMKGEVKEMMGEVSNVQD